MKIAAGKNLKIVVALLTAVILAGCADYTNQHSLDDPDSQPDPMESFNRAMFGVNNAIDTVILRPVTWAYRGIVPEDGRNLVSNFVHNLESPVYFANSVLQGDVNNSFATFWRFTLNSTFGIGGLLDVAGESGLQARDTDFGQTLAVWGFDSGSYLFVPVMGPSTVRDIFGRAVDIAFNPLFWVHPTWYGYAQAGITILDARSRNYQLIDDVNRTSLDPYATFRSGYLQRRAGEIRKAKRVHRAQEHRAEVSKNAAETDQPSKKTTSLAQ